MQVAQDGEYTLALIRIVARLHDPRAATALAESVDTGNVPWLALADFGDTGVEAIASVWEGKAARKELAAPLLRFGLLRALRTTLETGKTVSSKPTILAVAREGVERPGSAAELEAANDLALALDDPDLISQVRAMSADVTEIVKRGIKNMQDAERVQRRARESPGSQDSLIHVVIVSVQWHWPFIPAPPP